MKYITGQFALNIHHPGDKNEPTGDWHGFIWHNIKELPNKKVEYAGDGCEINTIPIWGNFGIYNDTENIKNKNIIVNEEVYIADYFRAILDLLYKGFKRHGKIIHLYCITYDHLDTDEQVQLVTDKALLLEPYLIKRQKIELHKWIYNELHYEEIRGKDNWL